MTTSYEIEYLENVALLITNITMADLEFYIWWSVVEDLVIHTTTDIRKLYSEYAKKVTKLEGGISRSLYCTRGVNQMMGMAVSYALIDDHFLDVVQPKVANMLENIRESFNNLVRWTTWMDDRTKCSTLEKSLAMNSFIGSPDWLLQPGKLDEFYAGIELNATTHIRNMITILQSNMQKQFREFRKNETFEWPTPPSNVNAFHTFQANAISKFDLI